jgi:hypothetical protein
VYQAITRLAKTDPKKAVAMLKDSDNAAYVLFHNDLHQAVTAIRKIDEIRETVKGSKIDADETQERLEALDDARQMFITHADSLNNLLFKRRSELRNKIPTRPPGKASTALPLTPPRNLEGNARPAAR